MTTQIPHHALVVAPDAAIAASRPPRRADHRFYTWACVAAFAVVFTGFARTYYLRLLTRAPALPWLLHLHGGLMTLWFVLFLVQTRLIASRRIAVHRRLGIFGAVLAGLMVVVGATVALRGTARDIHHPHAGGPPPLMIMGFFLAVLLVFATLVGVALLLRRRSDYHKRLMLLSCLSMVGPGLTRIPFDHVPALAFLKSGGLFGLFDLLLLLVYACIAWDTWRHCRLHPAFVGGALLMIAVEDPAWLVWHFLSTATWTRIATWLVSRIA